MAPIWKRQLAGWIDVLPSWIVILASRIRRRERDERMEQRLVRQLEVMYALYQVLTPVAFGQTLGQRVVGIRVVGQDTGRRPSLSQSTILWGLMCGPPMILRLLAVSMSKTQVGSVAAENLEELEARHDGEPRAVSRALKSFYKERGTTPLRGCLPSLLCLAGIWLYRGLMFMPSHRDPLNQSIGERIAKTLVIRDATP